MFIGNEKIWRGGWKIADHFFNESLPFHTRIEEDLAMNVKRLFFLVLAVVLVGGLAVGLVAAADDGPLFHRNLSRTPETMTGASQLSTMW